MSAPRPARGHVARSIAEGKRPFLTCTVSAETFRAIDRLATAAHTSRGRLIDRLVAEAVAAEASGEAAPRVPGHLGIHVRRIARKARPAQGLTHPATASAAASPPEAP